MNLLRRLFKTPPGHPAPSVEPAAGPDISTPSLDAYVDRRLAEWEDALGEDGAND